MANPLDRFSQHDEQKINPDWKASYVKNIQSTTEFISTALFRNKNHIKSNNCIIDLDQRKCFPSCKCEKHQRIARTSTTYFGVHLHVIPESVD